MPTGSQYEGLGFATLNERRQPLNPCILYAYRVLLLFCVLPY